MKISVDATIFGTLDKVWEFWNNPTHIRLWNYATDDWHCPSATNNLEVNGSFSYTMAAKKGRPSFNVEGTYEEIIPNRYIRYTMPDKREVIVTFNRCNGGVTVTELFEPDNENPSRIQKAGWQAILNNFKTYVENN